MSRYFSSNHIDLKAYVPGEQPQNGRYIKLNTNESPYPPSPAVFDALSNYDCELLRLYPDPECRSFISALSGFYGLPEEYFIPSNGSDEMLQFAFTAFADPKNGVAFPDITYGLYPVCSSLLGLKQTLVPLDNDFRIDPEDYRFNDRMIVFANPNAPTGIPLSLDGVKKILEYNPDRVVLVDEAYVDFGGESSLPLVKEYDNLLVVMTYSKSRSLAGARIAFAAGNPALIADLNKIRFSFNPYNLSRQSLTAAAAALTDRAYFDECRGRIISTREKTRASLEALGFTVLPSAANFLFVKPTGIGGKEYYLRLKEKGVLVRHFPLERIKDFVRISIGTDTDMDILIEKTKEITSEASL